MARNLKPKVKIARRLNLALTDKQQRILAKRNMPPGAHGGNGYPRLSEYGKQLQEKQKAKFIYGILERQFSNYFKKASGAKGDTGEILFASLERRLDNVVYRARFAKTRQQARQLVGHGHFTLNGRRVDIPSIEVKVGDIITLRDHSKGSKVFAEAKEMFDKREPVSWLIGDIAEMTIKITDLPKSTDMTGEFNAKAVIEFYSR